MGNCETVKIITRSWGRTYHKPDEDELPYTGANIHLILTGGLPEDDVKHLESFDEEFGSDKVAKEVDSTKHLKIAEDE